MHHKNQVILMGIIALLSTSVLSIAIDRDATMIDTIRAEWGSFEKADRIKGTLWGETTIADINRNWAVIAGIEFGQRLAMQGKDNLFWSGALGIKRYILQLTSVELYAQYGKTIDLDHDIDAQGLAAKATQRFIPTANPVSPYISIAGTYVAIDRVAEKDKSDDAFTLDTRIGADFLMPGDFAFVFEAGYLFATKNAYPLVDGHGPLASFGMKYYW